jgi:membrane fusion protein (multidrug efflux system)
MADTPNTATASTPTDTSRPQGNSARKKALTGVAAAVLLAGIGYGAYWALVLNHFESTDNAYVQGNVVQITPQMAGTVLAISADDTDHVKAGQWLVRLDPADAKIALDQAEATLAQTVREVRMLYANNKTGQAQISLRSADLARAQSEVARLQDDVNRRQPLLASGAVGREEFNHMTAQLSAAKSSVAAARSGEQAAREQLAASQSLTDGTAPDQHPSVLRAGAKVREAMLAMQRTELVAPVDGYVARRNAQLGQRVQAGAPLMSVIALDEVWVEANFKESQLKSLRLGQPVELFADVYGNKVIYHGSIEGMGAGTGAAFALLPAQNATGNWIKVVQRVPVRIKLDAAEVAEHPLRVGLSMDAKVDISQLDGPVLASATASPTARQTAVFATDTGAADAAVQRIVAANLGQASVRVVPKQAAPAAAPLAAASAKSPAMLAAVVNATPLPKPALAD